MLHLETISDSMHVIAKIIFESFSDEYYLAGGTALALHIGHRVSVDLDYFSPNQIDTEKLKQHILDTFSTHVIEIVYEDINTLWCSIDGVKVSFITRKDKLLKTLHVKDVFRLASLEDIVVMKLSAICGREEYKDYFDLACLSTLTDVRSWPSWWDSVCAQADMTSWLIALGSFETVTKIPLITQESFKGLNVENQLKSVVTEITNFIR
ncbi:MAG TPA: hypothetical protein DIS59_02355 [Candidatus Magasanikbacteria bacterium]|nr:hypothetical protein [Candidatus Magasanikbacteria bacterium]